MKRPDIEISDMARLILPMLCVALPVLICIGCSKGTDAFAGLYAAADSACRAENYTQAITLAMKASDAARDDGQPFSAGIAEDLIADIISETYGGPDVVSHRLQAAADYLEADSIRHHRYAMIDAAVAYSNIDSLYRAMTMLDSMRLTAPSDSAFVVACLRTELLISTYAGYLSDTERIYKAMQGYRRFYTPDAFDYACASMINDNLINKPDNSFSKNQLDSARLIARTSDELAFVEFANRRYDINHSDFRNSPPLPDVGKIDRESRTNTSVITSKRDFIDGKLTAWQKHASRLIVILSLGLLGVTTIAITAIRFYRLKIRVKNAESENRMEIIARISEELTARRNESDVARKRIANLYRERWETINLLCNEFFEKGDSEKTRSSIINEVEKELDSLRSPRKLRQIEGSVNECMDGLISRMRVQCPFLKEDDILFLSLIHAGFSPRAVSLFTGIKLKYFYTRRSRLIERIKHSEVPDREEFIPKPDRSET